MGWLSRLFDGTTVSGAILALAIVIGAGLLLGSVRVRGASLGVAGVLFAGLLLGHFGLRVQPELLAFLRDFGLVLFVFMVGLQIGPGFADSLRRDGVVLNALSVLGVGVSVIMAGWAIRRFHMDPGVGVGALAGAVTNTPSLASGQDALRAALGPAGVEPARLAGLAYAVTYPVGVLGPIVMLMLGRVIFRVNVERELVALSPPRAATLPSAALIVREPGAIGLSVRDLSVRFGRGITVSRLLRAGEISVPTPETELRQDDVIYAVAPPGELSALGAALGPRSPLDLRSMTSKVVSRRVMVTNVKVVGKTLAELKLRERFGVTVTRVLRAGVEVPPVGALALSYADGLIIVGPPEQMERAARELGNAPGVLDHPQFVPVMIGIALGILLGSIPAVFPGTSTSVKLGLAGGPLVVAIIAARVGRLGPLVWYVPASANFALREGGLALFLASVGLAAGPIFVETITHQGGMVWLACGAMITLTPVAAVLLVARLILKMNYVMLCGLIAGHGTQPAVLGFACGMCKSDAPGVSYAAVYPLTLVLRVVVMQLLVQAILGL